MYIYRVVHVYSSANIYIATQRQSHSCEHCSYNYIKNSLLSILRFKNITLKQLIVFIDFRIWNCSSARLSHRSMSIFTSPNAFSAPCLKRHHSKRFKLSDVLSLKQFIKYTNYKFIAFSSNSCILTYIVDKYWHIYNMCAKWLKHLI